MTRKELHAVVVRHLGETVVEILPEDR